MLCWKAERNSFSGVLWGCFGGRQGGSEGGEGVRGRRTGLGVCEEGGAKGSEWVGVVQAITWEEGRGEGFVGGMGHGLSIEGHGPPSIPLQHALASAYSLSRRRLASAAALRGTPFSGEGSGQGGPWEGGCRARRCARAMRRCTPGARRHMSGTRCCVVRARDTLQRAPCTFVRTPGAH